MTSTPNMILFVLHHIPKQISTRSPSSVHHCKLHSRHPPNPILDDIPLVIKTQLQDQGNTRLPLLPASQSPTVSHICSFICLLLMLIILAPNSTPIVRSWTGWNRLSVNCNSRHDFPTPGTHSSQTQNTSSSCTNTTAPGPPPVAQAPILTRVPDYDILE